MCWMVVEEKPGLLSSELRSKLIAEILNEAHKIDFVSAVMNLKIGVVVFETFSNSSIHSEIFGSVISNRYDELLVLIKPCLL